MQQYDYFLVRIETSSADGTQKIKINYEDFGHFEKGILEVEDQDLYAQITEFHFCVIPNKQCFPCRAISKIFGIIPKCVRLESFEFHVYTKLRPWCAKEEPPCDFEMPPDLFDNCSGLTRIEVEMEILKVLPGELFRKTPNITYVGITATSIESVPEDLFRGCAMLTHVDFYNNKLLKAVPDGLFRETPLLKYVSFSYTGVRHISKHLFEHAPGLRYAKFFCCDLETIDDDAFCRNVKLKHLDIGENKNLRKIPDSVMLRRQSQMTFQYDAEQVNDSVGPELKKFLAMNHPLHRTIYQQFHHNADHLHIHRSFVESADKFMHQHYSSNRDTEMRRYLEGNEEAAAAAAVPKLYGLLKEHLAKDNNDDWVPYYDKRQILEPRGPTFFELFSAVTGYVESQAPEIKAELEKIIATELESKYFRDSCVDGRCKQLLNCLSGFTDLVQFRIPERDQIFFIKTRAKLDHEGCVEQQKKQFRDEMRRYGYDDHTIAAEAEAF